MRFMIMHKMTPELEAGTPDLEIIAAVGQLIEEGVHRGVFVSGEGLKPTAQRTHLAYKDGERSITDGPFTETKELVSGFALMRVRSKEEAISWCDKVADALGDVEMYLGPVVEPWDLGMTERPRNPPLRFLALHNLDQRGATNLRTDPAPIAKMSALIDEMKNAGVLQGSGGLESTAKGARIHFKDGKHTVTDGPFTESKELVAGYAILKDLPSKEVAVEWAVRFGHIVKVEEVEVRQLVE